MVLPWAPYLRGLRGSAASRRAIAHRGPSAAEARRPRWRRDDATQWRAALVATPGRGGGRARLGVPALHGGRALRTGAAPMTVEELALQTEIYKLFAEMTREQRRMTLYFLRLMYCSS